MHPPAYGEINGTYEKKVPCARVAWPAHRFARALSSERLEHHQKHDADHEEGRYLIDDPEKLLGIRPLIGGKGLDPAGEKPVHRRQGQDQSKLGIEPVLRPKPALVQGQAETEEPRREHGRVDDRPQQPALHDLEGLRLHRARLGHKVVHEQARQIEHAGHPGDHRNDVEGFDPVVQVMRRQPHRTRSIMRSTWAIGVSGTMPCPRLKMKGMSRNPARTSSTARSRAAPPETSINGSRFPCTAARPSMHSRANFRSTVQSRLTALTATSLT